MYKLIKMSMPGWTREYTTRADLAFTLSNHMCRECLQCYGTDIDNMLASPCGLEFEMTGPEDNDEPLTEAEQWDVKLNGYKL